MIRGSMIFTELAPPNPATALVGDSITLSYSPFGEMNTQFGNPLSLVLNAGVGSERVAGTLARIDNAYNASPPGLSGLNRLGWVFLRIGTNDAAIDYPISSLQSDYDNLLAKILSYADRCVVCAVPPINAGSDITLPRQYNTYLRSKCVANPRRLTYLDDCLDLRSDLDTQIGSYFLGDGVHPNPTGITKMATTARFTSDLRAWLDRY